MKVIAYVSIQVAVPVEVDEKYQKLLDEDWSSENFTEDADLCDNLYCDLIHRMNENKFTILNDENLSTSNVSIDSVWDESDKTLIFED